MTTPVTVFVTATVTIRVTAITIGGLLVASALALAGNLVVCGMPPSVRRQNKVGENSHANLSPSARIAADIAEHAVVIRKHAIA